MCVCVISTYINAYQLYTNCIFMECENYVHGLSTITIHDGLPQRPFNSSDQYFRMQFSGGQQCWAYTSTHRIMWGRVRIEGTCVNTHPKVQIGTHTPCHFKQHYLIVIKHGKHIWNHWLVEDDFSDSNLQKNTIGYFFIAKFDYRRISSKHPTPQGINPHPIRETPSPTQWLPPSYYT